MHLLDTLLTRELGPVGRWLRGLVTRTYQVPIVIMCNGRIYCSPLIAQKLRLEDRVNKPPRVIVSHYVPSHTTRRRWIWQPEKP